MSEVKLRYPWGGRSDKSTLERTATLRVRQEQAASGGRDVLMLKESLPELLVCTHRLQNTK